MAKQYNRLPEDLLFLLGEPLGDRMREPSLTLAAIGREHGAAGLGELDRRTPPIVGIRAPSDESVGLEIADGLGHRLRPDPLRGGELTDAPWPLTVQSAEHGTVRKRETVLGAQPANQLTENDTQIAGEPGAVKGAGGGHD